jgi:GH43 family beta-xylosidase
MRVLKPLLGVAVVAFLQACGPEETILPKPPSSGHLSIKNADPTVIRVDDSYLSAESDGSRIYVRMASSVEGLSRAGRQEVFGNPNGWADVWAPQLIKDGTTYYIYFAARAGSAHRMYSIQSQSPSTGYSAPGLMTLPDDKWSIDGTAFLYNGQRYFVWSGWEGDTNGEQSLFIARMSSPTTVTGARYVISQPREPWEKADVNPPTRVNEGPEPIIDPSGQLHIVYSANGSWDINYCLADLRLKAGGDPVSAGDWYKSNGCLFGANANTLMSGWEPALYAKGVGHHSFVLLNGDPNASPPAGEQLPVVYHGVPRSESPKPFWSGRYWYSGTFQWWGDITYTRGPESNTGWSLKFYE